MSIEQDIIEGVRKKIYTLLDTVSEYEADTFSASASNLTKQEAGLITIALIDHALTELIELETLDGVRLTEELDNIREDE